MPYFMTSAATGDNVNKALECLLHKVAMMMMMIIIIIRIIIMGLNNKNNKGI